MSREREHTVKGDAKEARSGIEMKRGAREGESRLKVSLTGVHGEEGRLALGGIKREKPVL